MPLWKENLCSDHNKFHRYQQNEQSPLILTVLTEHKKTMTYDVGNLGPGLGQTHRCDRVKLVNGIYWSQPPPLDNRVNSLFMFVCVRSSRQSNSIVNIIHFTYSSSPLIRPLFLQWTIDLILEVVSLEGGVKFSSILLSQCILKDGLSLIIGENLLIVAS